MRKLLITHWCYSFCSVELALSKELFVFLYSDCEQVYWTCQRDIPYHTASWWSGNKLVFLCVCGGGVGWELPITLVSRWWAVILCITSFSSVLFLSLSLAPLLLLLYFVSIIQLFLSQPRNYTFFWFSSHCEAEWVSGCMLLSCQLGLNHDR